MRRHQPNLKAINWVYGTEAMVVHRDSDREPNRYLRLSIRDFFPTPLSIKVNDLLTIVTTIETKNIRKCKLSISYDPVHFLLKSPLVICLPEGSYSKDIRWELRSLRISSKPLSVEITAKEDGLIQTVCIPIIIS